MQFVSRVTDHVSRNDSQEASCDSGVGLSIQDSAWGSLNFGRVSLRSNTATVNDSHTNINYVRWANYNYILQLQISYSVYVPKIMKVGRQYTNLLQQ